MSNGSGGFSAPSAVLDKCRDNDFRVAIRSKPYKPRIVFIRLPLQIGLFTHNLGCAGFPRNIKTLDSGAEARSTLLVHNTPHRSSYDVDRGLVKGIVFFDNLTHRHSELLDLLRFHKMRLLQ